MRAKNFLTLDTEATGLYDDARCFDLGYVISNRRGVILERRFLVEEILTDRAIMLGAMHSKEWRSMMGGKLFTHYIPDLNAGRVSLTPWREIVATLRDDMRSHNVDVFTAYNLDYDARILRQTNRAIVGHGKVLDYRPDLLDLWLFSCVTVCNRPTYHTLADARGWRSNAGNVRTNAEKVYAYLSGDFDFIEEHTALEDARIETEILQRLLAAKKTIPYNRLESHPWRFAQ